MFKPKATEKWDTDRNYVRMLGRPEVISMISWSRINLGRSPKQKLPTRRNPISWELTQTSPDQKNTNFTSASQENTNLYHRFEEPPQCVERPLAHVLPWSTRGTLGLTDRKGCGCVKRCLIARKNQSKTPTTSGKSPEVRTLKHHQFFLL